MRTSVKNTKRRTGVKKLLKDCESSVENSPSIFFLVRICEVIGNAVDC